MQGVGVIWGYSFARYVIYRIVRIRGHHTIWLRDSHNVANQIIRISGRICTRRQTIFHHRAQAILRIINLRPADATGTA